MTNRAPLLSSATPFNRIVDLTRNPLLWTQVFSTLHSSWGFPLSYPSRSEDVGLGVCIGVVAGAGVGVGSGPTHRLTAPPT